MTDPILKGTYVLDSLDKHGGVIYYPVMEDFTHGDSH